MDAQRAGQARPRALDRIAGERCEQGAKHMSIELTRRDEFALITLNRPQALNVLSFELVAELSRRLEDVAASDARALLVTGAGTKAFCAGADVKELQGRSLAAQKRGAEIGQAAFARLERLPMPSIAIINGYAFGGGLELALACTLRIATRNARMALPEIKLGLIPGYGGTQRLPRVVGEARALDMILTGRTVEAEEAHHIGLVNRLVEGDPLEAGIAYARELACYSLPVLGFAREAVTRALATPLTEGLRIEADLSTLAFQTKDAVEGMSAFVEKRKPKFSDS
jgi:enoyl-CoA hydratase